MSDQNTAAPMPVVILETKMINKGAMVAVLKISVGKLVLHDVSVLSASGKVWAGTPSKPMIGRDGVVLKGDNGKTRYVPIMEWSDREARDRFSNGVIRAFEGQHGPIAALVGGAS